MNYRTVLGAARRTFLRYVDQLNRHHSPLSMPAGSRRCSLVSGNDDARSAIATVPKTTSGNTEKRGSTVALKLVFSIHVAIPNPRGYPKRAADEPRKTASLAKSTFITRWEEPSAFITAKSRLCSRI